jgi:hypothetical protein
LSRLLFSEELRQGPGLRLSARLVVGARSYRVALHRPGALGQQTLKDAANRLRRRFPRPIVCATAGDHFPPNRARTTKPDMQMCVGSTCRVAGRLLNEPSPSVERDRRPRLPRQDPWASSGPMPSATDRGKREPQVHAHAVIGKRDGTAHGGHLLQAHVRPTCEVVLTESPEHLKKALIKL